jgi:invasion protein IalB
MGELFSMSCKELSTKSAAAAVCGLLLTACAGDLKATLPAQIDQTASAAAWVKLCDVPNKAKPTHRNCSTQHERVDAGSGRVIISVTLREVGGTVPRSLTIAVAKPGLLTRSGMKAAVYGKDDWDRAARQGKIDETKLKPFDLVFLACADDVCAAELEATPDLIETFKSGGGLMVLALYAPQGKPVGFPVPLAGFADVFAGPASDSDGHARQRAALLAKFAKQ